MGKRELLIAIAFIAVGVVVYELTASPAKPGQGFSFSNFFSNARRALRANSASASTTLTGNVPAPATLKTLRLSLTGNSRQVKVVGEPRSDISYELGVTSTGPDEPTALSYAKQTALVVDDLGDVVMLRVNYPEPGRQSITFDVHVPSRLGLRIDGGVSGVDVANVAALQIDGVTGDAAIQTIAGALTGTHRNGDLKVSGAGNVKMRLVRSRSTFENVMQGLVLDLVDGSCKVAGGRGSLEIDQQRTEVEISGQKGTIRVGGNEGRVTVTNPADAVHVEVRRAPVELTMNAAVSATVMTTDAALRIFLAGPPPISIDAVASTGMIDAAEFNLSPQTNDDGTRLSHSFAKNADAPRLALRSTRGSITIRRASPPTTTTKPSSTTFAFIR